MQQRPVSSARSANSSSSSDHHVIDIMHQHQKSGGFSLYNKRGTMMTWQPWRRLRREKWCCHVIHAVPLVVFLCIFFLWWFSYPVNLEIKDGRLIAARKIIVSPQLVNQTRIDYTILLKQNDTPPPNPSVLLNSTLMDDTSFAPPHPTLINDTSAEPPIQPD